MGPDAYEEVDEDPEIAQQVVPGVPPDFSRRQLQASQSTRDTIAERSSCSILFEDRFGIWFLLAVIHAPQYLNIFSKKIIHRLRAEPCLRDVGGAVNWHIVLQKLDNNYRSFLCKNILLNKVTTDESQPPIEHD